MSFYTSLNGISNAQTELNVISNNLANAETTGFKASRVNFADIVAGSAYTNPKLVDGIGARVKSIDQNFASGAIQNTGSALDLAINGQGFFNVKSPISGQSIYTRNGNFSTDSQGFITDSNGNRLQIFTYPNGTTKSGVTSATLSAGLSDAQLPTSINPSTTTVDLASSAATLSVSGTSYFQVQTSGGTTEYTQSGNFSVSGNALVDAYGNTLQPAINIPTGATSVNISSTGSVTAILSGATAASTLGQITVTNFTAPSALTSVGNNLYTTSANSGTATTANPGSTGYGSVSGGTSTTTSSAFSGAQIATDGTITASYADGTVLAIGKVALASFVAPTGLLQLGDQDWTATGLSGQASYNTASANGMGTVLSGDLEQSNVDVSSQLVEMISAQQYFQANSKAISTANTMISNIMNATQG